jgi:anti-sigma factor RsiW
MKRNHPHLDDGALQALYDGEASLRERMRARRHLRMCARCAERSVAHRAMTARVTALLDTGRGVSPDTNDAWQRLMVRGGARPRARTSLGGVGGAGGALLAAVVAGLAIFVHGASGSNLVSTMYRMSAQSHSVRKGASRDDIAFARSLATLEAKGQLHRVSDVCCADRDGEGPPDDGVLTVTLSGSRSPVVILYEDTQRVGRFQPGDVVLFVSRRA